MTLTELNQFLDGAFSPAARRMAGDVVALAPTHVRMALSPLPDMLRPGGIVSGPIQMGLADVAAYAVILAHIGPVAMAVTNGLSISFLRACQNRDIHADAHLLKLGRRLATVDVRIWQDVETNLIAQSTVGYALP